MAKVRQGILGGFRGKIGNIIGTGWKGIAIMKAMPLSVANPRTAGQVKQRQKFSKLVKLASLLLAGWVKPLWDRYASQMSGYNAFVSANQGAFHPTGDIDTEALIMSKGKMLAPQHVGATVAGDKLNLVVTHPTGDKFGLPSDLIYVAWLDPYNSIVKFVGQTTAVRGASASTTLQVTAAPAVANEDANDVYVTYLRTDGSEVSNSIWVAL